MNINDITSNNNDGTATSGAVVLNGTRWTKGITLDNGEIAIAHNSTHKSYGANGKIQGIYVFNINDIDNWEAFLYWSSNVAAGMGEIDVYFYGGSDNRIYIGLEMYSKKQNSSIYGSVPHYIPFDSEAFFVNNNEDIALSWTIDLENETVKFVINQFELPVIQYASNGTRYGTIAEFKADDGIDALNLPVSIGFNYYTSGTRIDLYRHCILNGSNVLTVAETKTMFAQMGFEAEAQLTAPTSVTVDYVSTSALSISCVSSLPVQRFNLYLSSDGGTTFTKYSDYAENTSGGIYVDSLTPNTEYTYHLTATRNGVESLPTANFTVSTLAVNLLNFPSGITPNLWFDNQSFTNLTISAQNGNTASNGTITSQEGNNITGNIYEATQNVNTSLNFNYVNARVQMASNASYRSFGVNAKFQAIANFDVITASSFSRICGAVQYPAQEWALFIISGQFYLQLLLNGGIYSRYVFNIVTTNAIISNNSNNKVAVSVDLQTETIKIILNGVTLNWIVEEYDAYSYFSTIAAYKTAGGLQDTGSVMYLGNGDSRHYDTQYMRGSVRAYAQFKTIALTELQLQNITSP